MQIAVELIVRVLSLLPLVDLVSLQRVNRQWFAIIKNSQLLQYTIATQIAGVEDNPKARFSLSERLDLLRLREKLRD
jgi:hypothetical protein